MSNQELEDRCFLESLKILLNKSDFNKIKNEYKDICLIANNIAIWSSDLKFERDNDNEEE